MTLRIGVAGLAGGAGTAHAPAVDCSFGTVAPTIVAVGTAAADAAAALAICIAQAAVPHAAPGATGVVATTIDVCLRAAPYAVGAEWPRAETALAAAARALRVGGARAIRRARPTVRGAAVGHGLVAVADPVIAAWRLTTTSHAHGASGSAAHAALAISPGSAGLPRGTIRTSPAAIDAGLVLILHSIVAARRGAGPGCAADARRAIGAALAARAHRATRADATSTIDLELSTVECAVLAGHVRAAQRLGRTNELVGAIGVRRTSVIQLAAHGTRARAVHIGFTSVAPPILAVCCSAGTGDTSVARAVEIRVATGAGAEREVASEELTARAADGLWLTATDDQRRHASWRARADRGRGLERGVHGLRSEGITGQRARSDRSDHGRAECNERLPPGTWRHGLSCSTRRCFDNSQHTRIRAWSTERIAEHGSSGPAGAQMIASSWRGSAQESPVGVLQQWSHSSDRVNTCAL